MNIQTLVKSIAIAVATAGALVSPAIAAIDAQESIVAVQSESSNWYFTGTARIVSDITNKETWWPVYGYVEADSQSEAMAQAKEAAKAQAATAGRVLSVNVTVRN